MNQSWWECSLWGPHKIQVSGSANLRLRTWPVMSPWSCAMPCPHHQTPSAHISYISLTSWDNVRGRKNGAYKKVLEINSVWTIVKYIIFLTVMFLFSLSGQIDVFTSSQHAQDLRTSSCTGWRSMSQVTADPEAYGRAQLGCCHCLGYPGAQAGSHSARKLTEEAEWRHRQRMYNQRPVSREIGDHSLDIWDPGRQRRALQILRSPSIQKPSLSCDFFKRPYLPPHSIKP